MAWHVVKNPDTENYQIYSTIVDGFLLDDELTKEELQDFWLVQHGEREIPNLDKILIAIDKGEHKGVLWEEALMWDTHQREHGIKNRQPDSCAICGDIRREEQNG